MFVFKSNRKVILKGVYIFNKSIGERVNLYWIRGFEV